MALVDEIRAYVNLSHANAWRIAGREPDEPALVSSLLSKEMYRGLRAILRKHSVGNSNMLVKGIFTHQTPKVLVKGESKSVEIGDLLLIRQHFSTDPRKPVSGWALLLQAKRTKRPKTGSLASGTQRIQFDLYQAWPDFTGATRLEGSPLGATCWNFRNASAGGEPATSAAEYLTIFRGQAYTTVALAPQWKAPTTPGADHSTLTGNGFPAACTWSAGSCPPHPATARNGVACASDFGTTLHEFLLGRRGREFSPSKYAGSDHWSIFVNKMLAISAKPSSDYVYSSASQGVVAGMRGRNLGFMAAAPTLFLSVVEDVDMLLASRSSTADREGFGFSNALIDFIEKTSRPGDGEPPGEEREVPEEFSRGGHVPVLLVATTGRDDPFRIDCR